MCVNVTFVVTKTSKCYIIWVWVCSLVYLSRKTTAPYYVSTCGLSACNIFFKSYCILYYIYNIFCMARMSKKVLNIKFVLLFCIQSLSGIFLFVCLFISNQNQFYTIHIKYTVLWANEIFCYCVGRGTTIQW
jgi:hypothetical protein